MTKSISDNAEDFSRKIAAFPTVTFSIVSHGHGGMVVDLLNDLELVDEIDFEVILTLNISEENIFFPADFSFPLRIVNNVRPRGFAQNQNTAFNFSKSPFFCVLNPDVRLHSGSLTYLISAFSNEAVGAVGPLVLSPTLKVEDSARIFPTVLGLAVRFIFNRRASDYDMGSSAFEVDWLAGMFVVFRRSAFIDVSGFDERFFMYLEDADICRRLLASNFSTFLVPEVKVIHAAQRASKKSMRHFIWHLRSAIHYFLTNSALSTARN